MCDAKVRILSNAERNWPKRGNLQVQGFAFNELGGDAILDPKTQIRWLRLQSPFVSQPCEQMAKVFRDMGYEEESVKQIVNRLQDTVVKQQLQDYREQRQKCLTCGQPQPVKDYRRRRLDTVLGTVCLRVPRYWQCKYRSGTQVWNPISEVLPGRVTPE